MVVVVEIWFERGGGGGARVECGGVERMET